MTSKRGGFPLIANNIRRLRSERGWSQDDLIAKSGAQSVKMIESCRQGGRLETLSSIADAFGVPMAELFRDEPDDAKPATPIIGIVKDSDQVFNVDGGEKVELIRPPIGARGLLAISVTGAGLEPKYEPTSTLYFAPADEIPWGDLNHLCVVQIEAGATVIRRLLKGSHAGSFSLRAISGAETGEEKVAWAARIRVVSEPG